MLDLSTLLVVIAIIDVVAIIALFTLWSAYKSRFYGILHWIIGIFLSMTGIFLSLINTNGSKFLAISSVIIVISGALVVFEGMKRFFTVKQIDIAKYIIVSLLFIVYLIFVIYYPDNLDYQVIFLTSIGAFIFAKIYLFIRQLPTEHQKYMGILRGLVVLFILTSVFYVVYLSLPNHTYEFVGIFALLYTTYGILLIFQAIIMVNRRLYLENAEEHQKFGIIFYESPYPMLMIHQTSFVVHEMNQSFMQLFGYCENEVLGKTCNNLSLFSGLKQLIKEDQCILNLMTEDNEEFALTKKDHLEIPVLISKRKIQIKQENYLLISFNDITKISSSKKELEYEANHDFLTSLPNRRWLKKQFSEALIQANKNSHSVAVVICDINRFKDINDEFGHIFGDTVLIQIGQRMQSIIGEDGKVIRLGGDEFLILISKVTSVKQFNDYINKLKNSFKDVVTVENKVIFVSVSFGHALYPENGLKLEDLIRHSDLMMYQEKKLKLELKK